VGLDVFATGEHHNPPFVASQPDRDARLHRRRQTERIILSTATTLITTNDPVLIAEDYAMLQHLLDGRVDLMMGRGNTGPVYPWFGKDIRQGIPLAIENYACCTASGARTSWTGRAVPHPAAGLHLHPAAAGRRAAVRVARLDPQPRDRRAGRLLRRRVLPQQHLLAEASHTQQMVELYRQRFEHYGHGRADRRSSASAARSSCAPTARTPTSSGRTSTTPRSTATARPWRTSRAQTPLTVGSPQQVIDRYACVPRLRRPLPAPAVPDRPRGLPLKTVLEQLDQLGELLPEMRKGFAEGRPAHVPEAPTHGSLVTANGGPTDSTVYAAADAATGHRAEDAQVSA
jgi:alkanesulfonate monooxygenase SsuD/methylene tetrahydromethanopterin reductase-like flavin-dependent oxidoreductase (luciferase family)